MVQDRQYCTNIHPDVMHGLSFLYAQLFHPDVMHGLSFLYAQL